MAYGVRNVAVLSREGSEGVRLRKIKYCEIKPDWMFIIIIRAICYDHLFGRLRYPSIMGWYSIRGRDSCPPDTGHSNIRCAIMIHYLLRQPSYWLTVGLNPVTYPASTSHNTCMTRLITDVRESQDYFTLLCPQWNMHKTAEIVILHTKTSLLEFKN